MKTCLLLSVFVLFYKPVFLAPPSTATIAFISIIKDSQSVKAVQSAVSQVNGDPSVLPFTTLKLSDSTYSSNKVLEYAANLTSDNTLALFLDGDSTPSQELVSSLLQIPLLSAHPRHHDHTRFNVMSLAASKRDVNQAIRDVIKHYQWTTVLVLFDVRWRDEASGFLAILTSDVERKVLEIILDQEGKLFDETKKKLKQLNNKLVEVITLFCDAEFVPVVMEEVHSFRSRTAERAHHWVLADMLPSFTMVTEPSQIVLAFTPHIETNVHSQRLMTDLSASMTTIKNHSYYLYDSVLTFAHALDKVITKGQWVTETKMLNVEETKNGIKILNEMKMVNTVGATGPISFNSTGDRKGMILDVMNLLSNTFVKMGNWSSAGLKINGVAEQNRKSGETIPLNKLNRKIKVLVARDSPFLIVEKDTKTGKEKMEGYSVDLVAAIANILHFSYQVVEAPDGMYGTQQSDGSFNGIIGELMKKKADISAAPLTITSERLNHIMFSKPFMQFSMDILSQKPKDGDIDILAFMMPYSIPVWLMTLACLAFMTLMLTAINHFSPFGDKHGDNDGTGVEFSVFNSFWFSLASMLCQGADNTPKSFSGRILVGCFWFCILIWISTYTANLAAFFSFRDTILGVNSLQDIIDQEYVLHIISGTSLEQTFNTSNYGTYKKLYQNMLAEKSIVKTLEDGLKAVRANVKHLHMEEHPYAESHVHLKPCDLVSIKGFMGVRGYGFAMNKDFPYTTNISVALLKLQETGVIEDLKRKWWNYRSQCHQSSNQKPTDRLGLANMVGVYMLIAVGCILGMISMLVEMLWMKKGEVIKNIMCSIFHTKKEIDMVFLCVLCMLLYGQVSNAVFDIPSNVYISMFSSQEKQTVLSAVSQVNANSSLLPNTTLHLVESTFTESKMIECAMNISRNNISSLIFESKPKESHDALSSMLHTPLLSTHPFRANPSNSSLGGYEIAVGPSTHSAILDLIAKYKWTNLVVLFDVPWRGHVALFLSSLPSSIDYYTVDLLLDQSGLIKDTSDGKLFFLRNDPAEVIVLFCDASYVERIINKVFPLLAHTPKRTHRWLLADPIHSLNLVADSSQIIIGFAPSVYNNPMTASLLSSLSTTLSNTRFTSFLVFDAVFAYAHALHDMLVDRAWEAWATGSSLVELTNGARLLKYIKKVNAVGTTGILQFNSIGNRKNAVINVMNLRNGTFVKIGEWSDIAKLTITSPPTKNQVIAEVVPLSQLKRKIKVVLVEDPPFVMTRLDEKSKTKELVGFSVDLIKSIAEILHFQYEFYLSADGRYGGTNPDGSLAGVIGEVFKENADMSSMPLTINSERLELLGFSKPFMFYSMDMITKKPKEKAFDITGFMTPYTIPVWIMTFATWLVVSAILTFVNYYSPYGHRLCDEEQNGDEFNWFNSLWFCLASMLQQGGDSTPRMFSGRVVVGFFWFCVIVWVSTYTANLAAVLTTSQAVAQVNNLEAILTREWHAYVLRGTAFSQYLANSDYRVYRLLWERISAEKTFVDSPDEGLEKVRLEENTVYVEESPFSEYLILKEPCNLMSSKDVTGSSSYGIAMPKHYPYINNISIAILKMQESGSLEDLRRKWWSDNTACPTYHKPSADETQNSMRIHLENMVGVYVVLAAGGFAAAIAIFVEKWWAKRRAKIHARVKHGWTVVKSTTNVLKLRKKPDPLTVVKAFELKPKANAVPKNTSGVPLGDLSLDNDVTDLGVINEVCEDVTPNASQQVGWRENPWTVPLKTNSPARDDSMESSRVHEVPATSQKDSVLLMESRSGTSSLMTPENKREVKPPANDLVVCEVNGEMGEEEHD